MLAGVTADPLAQVIARLRARKAAEPIAVVKPRRPWKLVAALVVLGLIEVLR